MQNKSTVFGKLHFYHLFDFFNISAQNRPTLLIAKIRCKYPQVTFNTPNCNDVVTLERKKRKKRKKQLISLIIINGNINRKLKS